MEKVILIIDSGTTKTDWCIVRDGNPVNRVQTKGLNPYFQSYEELAEEIEKVRVMQADENGVSPGYIVDKVVFYGAGCVFDKADLMRCIIHNRFSSSEVHVYPDLLAAAHSTCGHEKGIACILGTGSNSCFYDGENIVKNIPPLGFILGDEGGGAMLGRLLVADILKELLPLPIRQAFFDRFDLTQDEILERVYRQPFPNRFLAGLSPFLSEHLQVPEIRLLVKNSFLSFLRRNVMQYDYKKYPVHFVGSVAFYYQEVLRESAEEMGILIGKIEKSPMEGLVQYTCTH